MQLRHFASLYLVLLPKNQDKKAFSNIFVTDALLRTNGIFIISTLFFTLDHFVQLPAI